MKPDLGKYFSPGVFFRLALWAGLVLTLLIAICGTGLLYLDTPPGKRQLVSWLNGKLGDETSSVEIGKVTGSIFGRLRVDSIRFKDSQGMWADLQSTEIAWKPWSLLSRTVDISSLSAKKFNIARSPAAGAEGSNNTVQEPAPLALPDLPFNLRIEEFDLFEINLDSTVTGRPMQLTSHGQLYESREQQFTIGFFLQRLGDVREELALDLSYDKPDDYLSLNGQLYIPARGLVATLLGTDLKEDIAFRLKGKGPRDDWDGKLAVLQGNMLLGEAQISNKKEVFAISANIDPGLQADLKDIDLLQDTIRLSILLKPNSKEDLKHLSVDIDTVSARLNADGRLHTEDLTMLDNVRYTIELKKAATLGSMTIAPFVANGTVTGSLTRPSFSLNSDRLAFETRDKTRLETSAVLNANMTGDEVAFNSSGTLAGLSLSGDDSVTGYIPLPVVWQSGGRFNRSHNNVKFDRISLRNEPSHLMASGVINLNGGPLDFSGTLNSSIAHLGDKISGDVSFDISARRESNETSLTLDLTGRSTGLSTGDDLLDDLTGPEPSLQSQVNIVPDGSLAVSTEITGSHVRLAGQLSTDPQQILHDSSYSLSFTGLDKLNRTSGFQLTGNLEIAGTIAGPLASPDLTANTSLDHLDLQGISLSGLDLSASFKDVADTLQGTLKLTADSDFGPLDISARTARTAEKTIHVSSISALFGPLQAEGYIDVPAGSSLKGEITLNAVPENQRSQKAANLFEGTLNAILHLDDQDGQQQLSSSGAVQDLRLSLPEGDVLGLEQTEWSGRYVAADHLPELDLSATARGLSLPAVELAALSLKLDHADRKSSFRIEASGTQTNPLALTTEGQLIKTEDEKLVLDASLAGQINNIPLKTIAPLHLEKTGDSITLRPAHLSLGEGSLQVAFSSSPGQVTAHTVASHADFRILNNLLTDLPFTGIVDGKLDVSADKDRFSGTGDITVSSFDTAQQLYAIDPDLKLGLIVDMMEQRLSVKSRLDLAEDKLIELSADLPSNYDFSGRNYRIDYASPFSVSLDWDGRIEPLWPMLNLYNHDLSGTTIGRMTVKGTLNDPRFEGQVRFIDGRYENIQSGFVAQDIVLESSIRENKLTLQKLTATDGNSGRLGAEGWISVEPDLSYTADVSINVDEAHLYRQPSLEIVASTGLSLKKTDQTLSLNGTVDVNRANINLVDQGPGNLIETDVVEINDGQRNGAEPALKKRHIGPLFLDLTLKAPKRVFVRGRGLDSEWAGDLEVSGSSDEVIINGTITLVKGTFSFSGKRFNLTRGEIRFPGNASNDPALNIESELNMTNLTAYIKIGGTAAHPALTITSMPELPQDEILSRILFGTSVTELSAWEAVQLASSIQALSGSGGPGMLDKMRGSIGIDRLSIGSDQQGDHGTLISGGKYLTNNIYVEFTTSSTTGATAQSVEVDLTKSLSLVTKRTLDQDNSLSIRWSWDY
ncbi:translocation/assembly module TamB domain-containing protein [Emcibacter sp.]|uniref:translocation/assembly module TamB domain-containing protein n=1 Tax=Emcibacter sp. TaxID=1979954 RepID=UPI002AA831A3|nr:translocation/assembly module TamB domain-containing protein [Emcibacter sp.]